MGHGGRKKAYGSHWFAKVKTRAGIPARCASCYFNEKFHKKTEGNNTGITLLSTAYLRFATFRETVAKNFNAQMDAVELHIHLDSLKAKLDTPVHRV